MSMSSMSSNVGPKFSLNLVGPVGESGMTAPLKHRNHAVKLRLCRAI